MSVSTSNASSQRTSAPGSRGASPVSTKSIPDELAREIAVEQAHVDRVHEELEKAGVRADSVQAEGLARSQFGRQVEVGDAEGAALFERDALVFHAAKRRTALDTQYEGLVFGRLDIDHAMLRAEAVSGNGHRPQSDTSGSAGAHGSDGSDGSDGWAGDREVRYIGRLGVRDDDYEPLVIDWRAPAASAFYRATPTQPMGVIRRRVLRCKGSDVVGVEDDLMVAEAPEDMVVVGDGALLAALTRSRGTQMRDIVATIQRHQDEAIRAQARGITEITGGPGTGKTVVALHRAAYLLYSDRRRYESGGILVVGPSAAYTSYIERVLPSLGEETVTLRSLGDVVDAVSTERLDTPAAAAIKGSLRIRQVLSRAAHDAVPDGPEEFRAFVAGFAVRLPRHTLDQVRSRALRQHQRNLAHDTVVQLLADAAYRQSGHPEREEFVGRFEDHLEVATFLENWWPQLDPREVLLWLADEGRLARYAKGILDDEERTQLLASMRLALETGVWSVADVALVDDVAARLGPVQDAPREERGFYEIEELDDLSSRGVSELGGRALPDRVEPAYTLTPHDARERLLQGRIGRPEDYAHVLVDEAQDLSPMQWRMLGRRGRYASWTVVGDAAQSSWPDAAESAVAREEAFGTQPRRLFHMDTNYRNAREIFDYAAVVVRREVPDADIPQAVRETGVQPRELAVPVAELAHQLGEAVEDLLGEVEGSIAVITPRAWAELAAPLAKHPS